MKKRIVKILGIIAIPVGALLLNACGPEGMTENESNVALDETSDNWIFLNGAYSEYGHCNNAQDDNGNGLVDGVDPDCHINPGPLRDLSVYDFPVGHNFFADIRMDLPGGPGFDGGFRDPELITRWFRFLTEPDGYVAGNFILGPGVNPEVVPVPMISPEPIPQGTLHQGNNNNLSLRALHTWDMYHPAPPPVAAAAADAPASDAQKMDASTRYQPTVYKKASGVGGGWPGGFYRAQGPFSSSFGSQGALKPARTGNPD